MLTLGLVWSLSRRLSRVAKEMTLNFYKYNIEGKKKNRQLSKGEIKRLMSVK